MRRIYVSLGRSCTGSSIVKSMIRQPRRPLLDLETLRETLIYMRDDLKRVPGFETTAAALTTAIQELDLADQRKQPIAIDILRARFLPAKRH
jgi:hypothetical protein